MAFWMSHGKFNCWKDFKVEKLRVSSIVLIFEQHTTCADQKTPENFISFFFKNLNILELKVGRIELQNIKKRGIILVFFFWRKFELEASY